MKSLTLTVATFVLMVAQTTAVDAQSPKLSLLGTKVELVADYAADSRSTRTAARVTANPQAHTETEGALERMGDTADRAVGKKYRLSIVIRNDDTKSIRAVTFEYPLGYSQGRKPAAQVSFKSRKEIAPAETVTVLHSFITSQYVVLRSREAVIKRIEYADGSIWRR
jgi:hypothetical protein